MTMLNIIKQQHKMFFCGTLLNSKILFQKNYRMRTCEYHFPCHYKLGFEALASRPASKPRKARGPNPPATSQDMKQDAWSLKTAIKTSTAESAQRTRSIRVCFKLSSRLRRRCCLRWACSCGGCCRWFRCRCLKEACPL